jgi:hypothetical protein
MACTTLLANPLAMTTTPFTRAISHDESIPWRPLVYTESRLLRMNWVVVIDKKGSRRLRMSWAANQD